MIRLTSFSRSQVSTVFLRDRLTTADADPVRSSLWSPWLQCMQVCALFLKMIIRAHSNFTPTQLAYRRKSAQDNLKYILSCMDNLPQAEIIGALLFLCYCMYHFQKRTCLYAGVRAAKLNPILALASSERVVFAICIELGKIVDLPRFSLIEVLREKYVDTDRPLS